MALSPTPNDSVFDSKCRSSSGPTARSAPSFCGPSLGDEGGWGRNPPSGADGACRGEVGCCAASSTAACSSPWEGANVGLGGYEAEGAGGLAVAAIARASSGEVMEGFRSCESQWSAPCATGLFVNTSSLGAGLRRSESFDILAVSCRQGGSKSRRRSLCDAARTIL